MMVADDEIFLLQIDDAVRRREAAFLPNIGGTPAAAGMRILHYA